MLETYPGIIKQVSDMGVKHAFKAHPEWKQTLLGRGEPKQALYDAVNRLRHGSRAERTKKKEHKPRFTVALEHKGPGRPRGKGGAAEPWPKEDRDLILKIMADPAFKQGDKVKWKRAWAAHPEWEKQLLARGPSLFMSFVGRIRKNGVPQTPAQEQQPVVIESETTLYTQAQVDELVHKAVEKALHKVLQQQINPVNFCPNCGEELDPFNKTNTANHRIRAYKNGEQE